MMEKPVTTRLAKKEREASYQRKRRGEDRRNCTFLFLFLFWETTTRSGDRFAASPYYKVRTQKRRSSEFGHFSRPGNKNKSGGEPASNPGIPKKNRCHSCQGGFTKI
jgi:hypothetical protein